MAKGINKVILIGNLGDKPELKKITSGSVANVSLATSESWKDKQTGQSTEKTEWHRVIFFSRLAEIVAEYCQKGSKIYVEGRLQTRKWKNKEGQDQYTTEIIANELQLLDNRNLSNHQNESDSKSNSQSSNYDEHSSLDDVPF